MNVLIVDDEIRAINALVKRINWEELGFNTPFTAYSMFQAQAVFTENTIHLMLCDIEMPQGNGLELFEWVRYYHPQTECIFVTCHDEYDYLRAAMKLGSCDYILKPINYDLLKEELVDVRDRFAAKASRKLLSSPVSTEVQSSNPYVAGILKYINDNLLTDFSISDIAESLHLNEQYLMRLFKKEIGCSILQHITSQRMNLAIYYLKYTDMPISKVALNSGFDNYSYFNRIFKRTINETPAKFRAAFKEDNKKQL